MMAQTAEIEREEAPGSRLVAMYGHKPETYFAGARRDIVGALKTGPEASILELGCGSGATGAESMAAGKCGRYVGIEIDTRAAGVARGVISEVLVGDVAELDLSAYAQAFDVLIASEVLEHVVDPWSVLRTLRTCLKPGAQVFASSPNVSHRKVLGALLRGRFDYEAEGLMDRTHLRWFTPATYRLLFEDTGFIVDEVRPLSPLTAKARVIDTLTAGRLRHLFMPQIMLTAHVP